MHGNGSVSSTTTDGGGGRAGRGRRGGATSRPAERSSVGCWSRCRRWWSSPPTPAPRNDRPPRWSWPGTTSTRRTADGGPCRGADPWPSRPRSPTGRSPTSRRSEPSPSAPSPPASWSKRARCEPPTTTARRRRRRAPIPRPHHLERALAGDVRPGEAVDLLATFGSGSDAARSSARPPGPGAARPAAPGTGSLGTSGRLVLTVGLASASEVIDVAHASQVAVITLVRPSSGDASTGTSLVGSSGSWVPGLDHRHHDRRARP